MIMTYNLRTTTYNMYKCSYITILAIGLVFLFGNISLASEQPTNNIVTLSTEITENTETELDIDARKQILINILESSQTEIAGLKDRLSKLKLDNDEWKNIKEELLNNLTNFEDYSKDNIDRINSTSTPITIEDIKDLAKDLKDWRENKYTPELNRTSNMILIFESANFLKITQSRFDKISADIKKLDKQGMIKTSALKTYSIQIDKHLKNIRILNDSAKKLFLKSMAPAEEVATSTEEILNQTAEAKTQENLQDTIRKMITDSLKELKITYEIFFQMNLVKK